jgi:hypothetical protein
MSVIRPQIHRGCGYLVEIGIGVRTKEDPALSDGVSNSSSQDGKRRHNR